MDSRSSARGRSREFGVSAAGLAAGALLTWAGITVHGGLRSAGEVAVARVAGEVVDVVLGEWERMLRAPEPPVAFSAEAFRWTISETGPSATPLPLLEESSSADVFATLMAEAERREVVQGDPAGALELVQEALSSADDERERAGGELRALQLATQLGREGTVRTHWDRLRTLDLALTLPELGTAVPARALAWLALPPALQREVRGAEVLSSDELAGLALGQDRLEIGPPGDPAVRFELAPLVTQLATRLGLEFAELERRRALALERRHGLPRALSEERWTLRTLAGCLFLARRSGTLALGGFSAPEALADTLARRAALPTGFALDLQGEREDLGTLVRLRTALPGSELGFTLRHVDPTLLAREESTRLALLRTALIGLGGIFVAGGFLLARVLARQRKLAELKSAFIAGVSHDLRTPLAALLLVAENLESGVAGENERAGYHQALRKETARLRRLIDDVLDFARLERGEMLRLAREEVALMPFTASLAEELRARVVASGREFVWQTVALPEEAEFDAHAVRRALENLVDNALKHGEGRIELACSAKNGRLCFAVADEGRGIPAGDREHVFEPFERLPAKTHVGGSGLGLAIVRAVARGHGGEARVRARDGGRGCVFELELALACAEDAA